MKDECASCGRQFDNNKQNYAANGNFCKNCMRRIKGIELPDRPDRPDLDEEEQGRLEELLKIVR